jgi:uncharacterized protein with HEPN domain
MSQRDSAIALRQMLDHAREAIILSKGKSAHVLVEDRVLGLAIVRLMEILIHGYDAIDYEIIWHILNDDLPELIISLERSQGGGYF